MCVPPLPVPRLASPRTRVALVLPVESRSQLAVQEEGLELLRSIQGPVAPVVVIG